MFSPRARPIMLSKMRITSFIGFSLAVWVATAGHSQAQFGGLQIQIGGGPFGGPFGGPYGGPFGGTGLYVGGFNTPFGVGPSIPPTSRAYIGPQYSSGYRGYYGNFGVPPTLGVYGSPYDYPAPSYRTYGYSSRNSLDQLQMQQYSLQRQQLELQAAQRRLSALQQYDLPPRYPGTSPGASSSTSDLRPGMVLPDGSTVLSVGPLQPANAQPSTAPPTEPATVPSQSSTDRKKAAF